MTYQHCFTVILVSFCMTLTTLCCVCICLVAAQRKLLTCGVIAAMVQVMASHSTDAGLKLRKVCIQIIACTLRPSSTAPNIPPGTCPLCWIPHSNPVLRDECFASCIRQLVECCGSNAVLPFASVALTYILAYKHGLQALPVPQPPQVDHTQSDVEFVSWLRFESVYRVDARVRVPMTKKREQWFCRPFSS